MAKKSDKSLNVTRDPKRFERRLPAGVIQAELSKASRPKKAELCKSLEDRLNDALRRACSKKEFEQTSGNCSGGGGVAGPVDLVVVIDTSGSMSDEASALSAAADAAIQAASQSCPSDLRVSWFGIEGTWPGTKFTQSYRSHLTGLGVPAGDIVGTANDREDGAAAVMDLSDHYDWRPGAARAIFYLGDEALEGGNPQNAADVAAADAAIGTANPQGVTVYTYFGTPFGGDTATTISEYARLATGTGGQAFVAPVANLGGFQTVLEQIICASQGEACRDAKEPDVVPCLRLRWGDGSKDQIETDDFEILCLTVCNPYCNVTLRDFTLHLVLAAPGPKPVPELPDGTPSAQIKPEYMICFGDIPPCDPKEPDRPSCVSREVVLRTCGAKEGRYPLFVAYCFEACFTKLEVGHAFTLDLVKS